MKLTFFIIFLPIVFNLSLLAQRHPKGHTINISGETVEIKIPGKIEQAENKKQLHEIKQLEDSIQDDLKDYTIEMQDQRFISDNVIAEVHVNIRSMDGKPALLVTYSYILLNDSLTFQIDDFGSGKYLVNESKALLVILAVMAKTIEGKLAKYITTDKEISITVYGSADAVPIIKVIPYNGEFGEQLFEYCDLEGQSRKMEVNISHGINNNQILAFLRSYAVKDYLENNIFQQKYSNLEYHLSASVSGLKGSQFRRVSIEMIIYNALK
jgi:hypothetical protein